MTALILGVTGMLGHKLFQVLGERFDVVGTARREIPVVWRDVFAGGRIVTPVTATEADVAAVLDEVQPDVVLNCIGVVKQLPTGKVPEICILINSLFPHVLARLCRERGARLIHYSTDCVFAGTVGRYTEDARPDAEDLYGWSKYLGEVASEGCLSIRTSMIGRELSGAHGLIEWFLANRGGTVKGFRKAIYSGFTTTGLADVTGRLITDFPDLSGMWHVAAEPVTKYDLLMHVNEEYGTGITIESDETFFCDRSLDGSRFTEATGIEPYSWKQMISDMRRDPTPYDELRAVMADG